MAGRTRHSKRAERDSESLEAVKPLVVLILFGTILYGAYSVVQKGPSVVDPSATHASSDAPPFAPPTVELSTTAMGTNVGQPPPVGSSMPVVSPAAVTSPTATANPMAPSTGSVPGAPHRPDGGDDRSVAALTSAPTQEQPVALPAAALAATTATAAAVATAEQGSPRSSPTYLAAESAPPPAQDSLSGSGASATAITAGERPDRYASLPTNPPAPVPLTPGQVSPVRPAISTNSSAAFASAWADAHEKLAAGRYAEALTALSIWYDDPSLGLEESQRLDDLLGQLAGTVIYSQHHLLLPPRIVAPGETLASVAAPLGVSWQLLGKINGVANPQELFPGEHLKVVRGPFDAVVSVSRRRLSLQLGGNYAGSFPVGVGRDFMSRVGSSIPVSTSGGALAAEAHAAGITPGHATPSIALVDGLRIDAVDDPSLMSENTPPMSLVVTGRDFADIVDILGPGSKVLIRQ